MEVKPLNQDPRGKRCRMGLELYTAIPALPPTPATAQLKPEKGRLKCFVFKNQSALKFILLISSACIYKHVSDTQHFNNFVLTKMVTNKI